MTRKFRIRGPHRLKAYPGLAWTVRMQTTLFGLPRPSGPRLDPGSFPCLTCGRFFASPQARASHALWAHGRGRGPELNPVKIEAAPPGGVIDALLQHRAASADEDITDWLGELETAEVEPGAEPASLGKL